MRGACGVLRRTRLVEPKGSLQNLPLRHIKKAPFGFVGQRGLLSASVGIDSSLRSSPLRGACGVLRRAMRGLSNRRVLIKTSLSAT